MMKRLAFVLFLVLAWVRTEGATPSVWPLTTLRLACKTDEELRRIIDITVRHRGSFDEYWLSYMHPWYDDEKVLHLLGRGGERAELVRAAGIRAGDQQGLTIGHGSALIGGFSKGGSGCLDIPEDSYSVGRDGTRQFGFCPRSPFVLAREEWYVEQVCRLERPVSLWLDDDLRNGVWKPDACFCDRCLKAFNSETGRSVTRQELVGRLFGGQDVDDIRSAWFDFNERSLALFAAAARRGANKANPSLQLCLQSANAAFFYSGAGRRAVLWELSDHGRCQTGIRCGSGYYTEFAPPRDLIRRLQHVGREAARCRAYGDWMGSVTYENETYTHQVLNKTWEASLKENALSLAVGCDAVTMYWYDSARPEPMELFEELAGHLAAWRPYFERLSAVSRRTSLGGVARKIPGNFRDVLPETLRKDVDPAEKSLSTRYTFEHPMDLQVALYGIPVTVAEAGPQAFYTEADRWIGEGHENNPTTAELEKMRDLFDARSHGSVPVRIGKAQQLVVWPRVDDGGRLVAVTFFNCSMGRATKVPVRLRNPSGTRLTWMSGESAPCELASRPGSLSGERLVTLPDIPGFDLGTVFVD